MKDYFTIYFIEGIIVGFLIEFHNYLTKNTVGIGFLFFVLFMLLHNSFRKLNNCGCRE
jgi:preprotein translocase subunit SecG